MAKLKPQQLKTPVSKNDPSKLDSVSCISIAHIRTTTIFVSNVRTILRQSELQAQTKSLLSRCPCMGKCHNNGYNIGIGC